MRHRVDSGDGARGLLELGRAQGLRHARRVTPQLGAAAGISAAMAVVTLLLLAVPVALSPIHGFGRFLSPVGLAAIMLMAIFGARPLALQVWGTPLLYGLDPNGGFAYAQRAGLLVALAFTTGALCGRGRTRRGTDRAVRCLDLGALSLTRVLALTVAGMLVAAGLVVAKGGLSGLLLLSGGRGSAASLVLSNLPTVVLVLPLLGSTAVTLFLARTAPHRRLRQREVYLLLLAVLVCAGANLTLGNRRFILPCILAPLAAVTFARGGRAPRAFLPLLPVGLVALTVLPLVRAAGARTAGQSLAGALWQSLTTNGLLGVIRTFLTSYDTEMFSYIAVVGPRLGGSVPLGAGRGTFLEFLQYPLPSALAGRMYSDSLLTHYYGGGCGSGICPVASAPGTLLFDFGLPGMVAGMFVLGFLLRRADRLIVGPRPPSPVQLAAYAVISAYAPILVRSNATQATWWLLYTLGVGALAVLAGRRIGQPGLAARGRRPGPVAAVVLSTP